MKISKLSALLLASLLMGSVILSACDGTEVKTEKTQTEETTAETTQVTESASEATTASASEVVDETVPNGRDTTPYEEITLSGNAEDHFVATDFCFIEGEKCVLFLQKDIDIPGDYLNNIDTIIDEIEVQLGVPYNPEGHKYGSIVDMSVYWGENPWEDWYIGTKIPIFLVADYDDAGLISGATGDFVVLVEYELFSDELWESVPSYKDNDWRKLDYISYSTAAHEITHAITSRYCDMTMIMTEGIAEYTERKVIEVLGAENPAFEPTLENRYLYDNAIPEVINADNAEATFISDYSYISHAERGAEYTFGRYLWTFLFEKYGNDSFGKCIEKIKEKNIDYGYGNYEEEAVTQYADTLKELFGDDVFTEFGNWCVENNALQSTEGVW